MARRDFGFPPQKPSKPDLVPPRKDGRWIRLTGWAAGILLGFVVIVGLAAEVLLRSTSFHNYVLRTVEQNASASLNTRVQLQNFAVHPSILSLDLYGLTVYGMGPGAGEPLLQVDRIGLGMRIVSLLRHQWRLANVTVNHPVVRLVVNSSGENNLPNPQRSTNSNTNIIDLAIGHILLDRGEIYYNNRKSALDAEMHDLQFLSNYDAAVGARYVGRVSYRQGWLHYDVYSPVDHDLQAEFQLRRDGITLSNVMLKSGQSQILLNASLEDYINPKIELKYVITLATGDIRHFLNDSTLPAGLIVVNGTAHYTNVSGRALLDAISLEGTVNSAILRIHTATLRADVRNLDAQYSLANGNAEVRNLRARLLGGELTAAATVRNLCGKQEGHLAALLHNVSLADMKTLVRAEPVRAVAISGQANARTEATWSGSFNNLMARADATANGNIASSQQDQGNGPLPIDAYVRARYAGAKQELSLEQSFVRTPQTTVTANGTVSRRSALQVRASSNDLHELETVAGIFTKPPPQPLDLHGKAVFNGTVRDSIAAPQIAGQLNAGELQVRGSAISVLRTSVDANPSLIKLQNGYIALARQGHATFNVQSGLHDWSYTPASQFAVNVTASELSVAEIARAVGSSIPITGILNANMAAHGTQLNPVGQGEITLHNATAFDESIHMANVRFQGTGDALHANLAARIAAGMAQGQITYYPKQQGYDAQLQAANLHLEQIRTLHERNLQAAGTLTLTASGRGTLQDPQGQVSLTIPQLDIQKQQIRNLNLQANVAHHQATFALDSQVLNNPLRAQGKVALTGDYYADASLDTPVIPLQPLLAAYASEQAANLSGKTEVHATLRGPLKKKALLEAHVNIPTLAVAYQRMPTTAAQPGSLEVAAVTPIRADYVGGVLTLQPGEIKGTGTDLRFQGRLPLASDTPSTLSLRGSIDLMLAQVFDPTLTSDGQVQIEINSGGHAIGENVAGQIRIVNASFSTPDMPMGVSNGNGLLTLRGDRIDITQLTADVGGGAVSASGGITYRPGIQFNIGLKGSGLRLLYPQTVRSQLDLNLAMTGTTKSALLQGQINLDRMSFTPDFELSSFANQFSGVSTPPPTEGFADNLKLNVSLRSTSELNVASPELSIQGDANLRVIGTATNPVIVGRASLSGGDLIFLGNRYVLESSTIAFVNSFETRPVVNLQATTTVQQYNIAIRLHGPLDRLQTSYSSDPSLPPADIIHLLTFGKTEEAANAAPSQSATLGAESLIASQVTSQITNRVQKIAGISQLSVDPQLSNNGNQQPGARITVQQRVTSKLFVTFTTDVTTTQNTAVQMQYQLNRKWSVSGVRDWNTGFGIDGRYHKDF
jgi:translocation and assembly module TamB